MKKQEYEILKAKAEVYGQMYVENRVFLFATGKTEDEFPMDFQDEWDVTNPDVHIYDSMAEFVFRGFSELESAFDCFFMTYYNAELYHNGKEFIGTKDHKSFTTPAEDGIVTLEQENEVREIMYNTIQETIWKSEWVGHECFEDALAYRKAQQSLMDQVENIIQ